MSRLACTFTGSGVSVMLLVDSSCSWGSGNLGVDLNPLVGRGGVGHWRPTWRPALGFKATSHLLAATVVPRPLIRALVRVD